MGWISVLFGKSFLSLNLNQPASSHHPVNRRKGPPLAQCGNNESQDDEHTRPIGTRIDLQPHAEKGASQG